jgi:phosphatidylglycerol:prolipoprotein diacylglycerol transferase
MLVLDSAAPSLLIGQGIARIANYINQELYGPPTDLPWGIPISPQHRIPPWNDLSRFPAETTRFHPTFAYEMLWNFAAAGLLLWLGRRLEKKLKPGSIVAGWLVLAGIGRVIIETWRPDQPRIPGTGLSYSRLVAMVMALAGVVMLLVKYKVVRLPFLPAGRDEYQLAPLDDKAEPSEQETSAVTE